MSLWIPILLSSGSFAVAPPDPGALTTEELTRLAAREIVVREAPSSEDALSGALGVIELAAPVDRTLDAILDIEARVGEISGLRSARIYDRTGDSLGVRWELRVIGTTVVFHVRYAIDRSAGRIRFALDPTRVPNDLVRAEGTYRVIPTPSGSRILFETASDSGRSLPAWLKRWLATEAPTRQLEGIRRRAEAAR